MAEYKPYGNKKSVPSRKVRKSERNKIFMLNKSAKKRSRKLEAEAASQGG